MIVAVLILNTPCATQVSDCGSCKAIGKKKKCCEKYKKKGKTNCKRCPKI